jgi:hypothetical protein
MNTTYRIVDLADRENVGQTAATADLALLAAGSMARNGNSRFAIEETDWIEEQGRHKPRRSVIIEAEDPSNPWKVGP